MTMRLIFASVAAVGLCVCAARLWGIEGGISAFCLVILLDTLGNKIHSIGEMLRELRREL